MKEAGRGARLRGVEVVDVVRLSLLRVLQFLYTCCGGNRHKYTSQEYSGHVTRLLDRPMTPHHGTILLRVIY